MKPYLLMLATAVALTAGTTPGTCADSEFDYIDVKSKSVNKDVRVGIYLPAAYDASKQTRFPTLYFLHGMFGSERKWESRGIPEQLDGLIESGKVDPMIVVCPNGENSMYVNWKSGKANWEDFVAEDLVAAVDARYRTISEARARGISGDSLGGYGALNIAFQHPDVFGAVSAHSAALYPVDPDELPEWIKRRADQWSPIFGFPVDLARWKGNNPLWLAETLEPEQLGRLAIYFDCGNRDRYGFDSTNADLSGILDDRGVTHEFHLRDGGHGREYFTENASESLGFHGRAFRAALGDDDSTAEPPAEEGEGAKKPPARREF